MRRVRGLPRLALTAALLLALPGSVGAGDIRQAWRKAQSEREAALAESRAVERSILADRERLHQSVVDLEREAALLAAQIDSLTAVQRELAQRQERLQQEWADHELAVRELSGNIRLAARDAVSLLESSPLTALEPGRIDRLRTLLTEGTFPGVDDVSALGRTLLQEIRRGGEVAVDTTSWIARDGREVRGPILRLGALSVARADDHPDLLRYQPGDHRLYALTHPSPRRLRRDLARYLAGRSEGVPVDLSGGAALAASGALTGPWEQLRAGGPLVWPILLIGLVAAVIVIERLLTLRRVHGNTEELMNRVNELAAAGDWNACRDLVDRHQGKKWPIIRVLRVGLAARDEARETLESILQEAILRELPRLERALPLLAILGAVAPLLGLLGTVSGMIETFRIITLYGTSDPRLMAGGISEALITTELGLAVAIPVMLLHAWLSRRVEHVVGDLEEKAVALTNIVCRQRS